MKRIILVVEDSKQEQKIIKSLILAHNYKVIIADNLKKAEKMITAFNEKLFGIITDIHFPIDISADRSSGANGISVVIMALQFKIPCVVCTDSVAHGVRYIPLVLEKLEKLAKVSIPISSNKDWRDALSKLEIPVEEK